MTGSVGKTSTVAMAAHALAGAGASDRSRTSANSPYGIGWNLASMDRHAKFWIQEVAATRMDACSRLTKPHVAIVTAIAPAHAARFGSTEQIARQKALIYTGMAPGGIAVINADMAEFPIFESAALAAQLQVLRFGSASDCHARLLEMAGATVQVEIFGVTHVFELGAPGRHMAMNATAVLAAVAALGLPVSPAARQLGSFVPLRGRGQRNNVNYANRRIEVWDESYNANPASMRAALRVMLDAGPDAAPHASRVLILGDMLELGADSQAMHLALESDVRALHPDRVLLCGHQMRMLWERLQADVNGQWFTDIGALVPALHRWIKEKDVVLVKGSNSIGLTQAVNHLLSSPAQVTPVRSSS
ncbi:UDP-N-acetylmuramoyl-tripeptide--D-alanyl-D-alanine ligase [Paraburkholderia sp. WSM4175]